MEVHARGPPGTPRRAARLGKGHRHHLRVDRPGQGHRAAADRPRHGAHPAGTQPRRGGAGQRGTKTLNQTHADEPQFHSKPSQPFGESCRNLLAHPARSESRACREAGDFSSALAKRSVGRCRKPACGRSSVASDLPTAA